MSTLLISHLFYVVTEFQCVQFFLSRFCGRGLLSSPTRPVPTRPDRCSPPVIAESFRVLFYFVLLPTGRYLSLPLGLIEKERVLPSDTLGRSWSVDRRVCFTFSKTFCSLWYYFVSDTTRASTQVAQDSDSAGPLSSDRQGRGTEGGSGSRGPFPVWLSM